MQVIPAINCASYQEAKKRIEVAGGFADLIHIDVVDGKFAPNVTWGSPEDLERLKTEMELKAMFEVHLMVQNPEGVLDAWLRTGLVKRVIVHLEAMTDSVYVLEKCKKYGVEAMLAINPGTEAERLSAHLDDFHCCQILAVFPGLAGQKFQPHVLEKLEYIRKRHPNVIIEVDGGMNAETAAQVKKAGADIAIAASYIFSDEHPKEAYERLVAL